MNISVRDVRYTNDAALICRGFGDKKDKCPKLPKTLDKFNQLIYTP